nr:xylulose kinase-1 [Tanacetum cinerariifolium]
MNIWKVIQNGNNMKRTKSDQDGRVIILPLTIVEEHIAVQRESKARTTLLQSIPDDHVADFHYMDDARDIWNAVKARFGGKAESKKIRKSMLKQEFSEFRTGDAGEFALMGVTSKTAKKDLQIKLDNHLAQTERWRNSSKNLFKLIDNVEGRPVFHSNKYSKVNTNDFASSDSSVKSLEHKPSNSTSCASTSNVSTSVNEAEIESNVGTPIKEPIIVQDLPSFSSNSSDKNEHTSRTSCNKNGYFNKKACHFRKNASSVFKLCFVCDSGTYLIKDCDFYEKQMADKTVRIGVGVVHSMNKVNHENQFVPQVVLLRTGKVNIPPARPQPVPTSKPKVFAPVPTGRPNRPFPVPTDRGYSPSVVLRNHVEKVYIGYPRTILDLIHLHTDDNVVDLLTKAFDGPRVFNSPMLHLLRVEMVINSSWIMPILGTKELNSPEQTAPGCDIPTGRVVNAVTYTSVYTDSEPGRVFWGADEELSDRGSPRVIMYVYDRLPMMPVASPSPDYIPGLEEPHTPLAPHDEDEHEPIGRAILLAEEQPLPPVVSPTTESPGYVAESDPKRIQKSMRMKRQRMVQLTIPWMEEMIEMMITPVIPPPSTDAATTGARITVRLEATISFPPEAEVERLLAMPTLSPSPLASLSPPSTGERLARCMASAALPSPPLPPPLYMPLPIDRRDDIPETEMPPRKRLCLSTLSFRYEVRESLTARPTGGQGIDYGRQAQMAKTLRVMGDMRREMGDMQAELLALRGQPRRVGQPRGDARVPNHQDAPRDADIHI